jgi:adenylosuccinate lyase
LQFKRKPGMELTALSALSPIDGRYRNQVKELANHLSEYGLIRYRVHVEIEYFIALCELPLPQLKDFDKIRFPELRKIVLGFTMHDAQGIKEVEKKTNHDVKAVEYFIKGRFDELGLGKFREFVHFGLTSQDINNTAVPYSLKIAFTEVLLPALEGLICKLDGMAEEWKSIPMLAHTHGQPASPTKLGKEIRVFADRLREQKAQLLSIPWSAKFGGATGNFNAHTVAYPQISWPKFADMLVNEKLGLSRSAVTTQIEHYDNLAAFCDASRRVNTILIDLCRDLWTYISLEYFKQKIKDGEIGSSAMPHKVNPIDFENAEGNLGVANALFSHFSEKLPISRMQRDLTDSTVLRNLGVPVSHTLIAVKSLIKGLDKILLNEKALEKDLESNWAVVAEGIQTILRREGYPNAYEALLGLTRTNKPIDKSTIREFIDGLQLDDKIKAELYAITPQTYTGLNLY